MMHHLSIPGCRRDCKQIASVQCNREWIIRELILFWKRREIGGQLNQQNRIFSPGTTHTHQKYQQHQQGILNSSSSGNSQTTDIWIELSLRASPSMGKWWVCTTYTVLLPGCRVGLLLLVVVGSVCAVAQTEKMFQRGRRAENTEALLAFSSR